jgi:LacI family transcriptional regulator
MAITIREVAQRAGVCASTVSLVLNKKPGISEATRRRVEETLKGLDYRPNVAAQTLVKRQIRTIGVIYSDHLQSGGVPSQFALEVLDGIRSVSDASQANLLLVSVTEEFRDNHVGLHMMHQDKLAGAILVAVDHDSPFFSVLKQSGLPFVDVNRRLDENGGSYVVLDYAGAAASGVRHLIECGYDKIGVIVRETRPSIAAELLSGYRSALKDREFHDEWVASHDATVEGGRAAMHKLLNLGLNAAFVSDNIAARGALMAVAERGLSVPGDVGIVGMHDYSQESEQDPPITSIRYSTVDLGRTAVETLFRLMDNPSLAAQRSVIRTELVIGQTTGRSRRPEKAKRRKRTAGANGGS